MSTTVPNAADHSPLMSVHELQARLGQDDLSIVDASWSFPGPGPDMGRDAHAEYLEQHIPGAVFFNIDTIADQGSGLPHTLAAPEQFAQAVGQLGIQETDTIVVYDGLGLFSAARVWWNFRLMGAHKVRLLDGGLPAWQQAGFALEGGEPPVQATGFKAQADLSPVADLPTVMASLGDGQTQIVDARPAPRFHAQQPEPRPGMRSGHMPGALNLPFPALLTDGRMRPVDELRQLLADAGIDPARPVITSCGSGVTAAIITLALELVGHEKHRLYDGSWSEWGGRSDTPIEP